tara:strand:- start:118784 stop:118966 length:183 start_codon:yes stop_codon:yes gene_type:complete
VSYIVQSRFFINIYVTNHLLPSYILAKVTGLMSGPLASKLFGDSLFVIFFNKKVKIEKRQ